MNVITILNKEYQVLEFTGEEVVKSRWPNFHKKGIIASYTLKRRGRIYTAFEFQKGFSKPMLAYGQ